MEHVDVLKWRDQKDQMGPNGLPDMSFLISWAISFEDVASKGVVFRELDSTGRVGLTCALCT